MLNWILAALATSSLALIACDEKHQRTAPSMAYVPEYNVEIVLARDLTLRGTDGVQVSVFEGPPEEADGHAEISTEAEDASTSAALTGFVPASDILQASWEALRVPLGWPGARSAASLTVRRGGEEINAESGVIKFQRNGNVISGTAEVEPESTALTFSGTCVFTTCAKADPNDPENYLDDPHFESDFCQRFASLASDCTQD
jgi:hypothetical protein